MNRTISSTAMVFAAGLGIRMRPLTDTTPKPLLEVDGLCLLERIFRLAQSGEGIHRLVVNGHYLADQVRSFCEKRAKPPELVFSDESRELLESGGAVRANLSHFSDGDALFCFNSDSFWVEEKPGVNIEKLSEYWDPDRMEGLILLADPEKSLAYDGTGDFILAAPRQRKGAIKITRRADGARGQVYTGAAVFSLALFGQRSERVFSISPMFDEMIARGTLFGVRLVGDWLHVGTPEALIEATLRLQFRADK